MCGPTYLKQPISLMDNKWTGPAVFVFFPYMSLKSCPLLYLLTEQWLVELEAEAADDSVVWFSQSEVVVIGCGDSNSLRQVVGGVRVALQTFHVDVQFAVVPNNFHPLHWRFQNRVQRFELVRIKQCVVHGSANQIKTKRLACVKQLTRELADSRLRRTRRTWPKFRKKEN